MRSDAVIEVNNVSKLYRLGKTGARSFGEDISRLLKKVTGKEPVTEAAVENRRDVQGGKHVWALQDICFSLKQGEVLGIVGRNGAGKSTLLKILSGITHPTTGELKIKGRIASLLEVGTGFHPELSGKENIYLNGAILGMSRTEINAKYDEIVDFSGVAKYLDTPVKRYSSGMRVRLGFAVAAHLEPEILVVDEVLAVGDAEFQKKALGKMKEVSAQGGRTVLFVSHNMASLRRLCTNGLLLEHGRQVYLGDIDSTIKKYNESGIIGANKTDSMIVWNEQCPGSAEMKLRSVKLLSALGEGKNSFSAAEQIHVHCTLDLLDSIRNFRFTIQVLTLEDDILFTSTSHECEPGNKDAGSYLYKIILPSDFFNKGAYKIRLISDVFTQRILLYPTDIIEFYITETKNAGTHTRDTLPGFTSPKVIWNYDQK